jgi:hypothetical protein
MRIQGRKRITFGQFSTDFKKYNQKDCKEENENLSRSEQGLRSV